MSAELYYDFNEWRNEKMKLMLKTAIITVGIFALVGTGGYFFVQHQFSKSDDITEIAQKIKEREETPPEAEPSKIENAEADLDEVQLQVYLHQMTHQKIVAEEKRGAIEMTPENIQNLLIIVQENYEKYEHGDYYESVLNQWKNGNFANSVEIHNTIWNWHNGTVGRATGLMNEEEERKFVEEHFR